MPKTTNFPWFVIAGLWLLFFFIFELVTMIVRFWFFTIDATIIMFLKLFLLSLFIFYKFKAEKKPYLIAVVIFYTHFILIFIYQYIFKDSITMHGWFGAIMGILGAYTAYIFVKYDKSYIRIIITLGGIITIIIASTNYKYIDYINLYHSPKMISGIYVNPNSYSLINEQKDTVYFDKNKTYILDFWYTMCGACYKAFPSFEKLNKKNTDSSKQFVAVNFPISIDNDNDAFEKLKGKNYSFPVWKGSEKIDTAFKIPVYPTYIVFRNDTILYKGTLERMKDYLAKTK